MASLTMEQKAVIITNLSAKIGFYAGLLNELNDKKDNDPACKQDIMQEMNGLESKLAGLMEAMEIIQEA